MYFRNGEKSEYKIGKVVIFTTSFILLIYYFFFLNLTKQVLGIGKWLNADLLAPKVKVILFFKVYLTTLSNCFMYVYAQYYRLLELL